MPLVAAPLGAGAFRVNSQRQGQVIFRGCQLVERADVRLPALHRELYAATVPTQWSGMRAYAAIMAAVGAAFRGKGKAKAGPVCRGRSPWGKCAMTAAQRQRLHRARTALREVVRELGLARGSKCEPLQAGPSKRALSMAERQEVSRACRARRASAGR